MSMPGFGEKQQGTAACKMRDLLWSKRFEKKITLAQITDRMYLIDLPEWMESQILSMVKFNQLNRPTDAVEQAMAQSVYMKIVGRITKE